MDISAYRITHNGNLLNKKKKKEEEKNEREKPQKETGY